MARRSKQDDPESLRRHLLQLVENFEERLLTKDLREQVIALIPAFRTLRDLGSSLVPRSEASGARQRILYYFQKYPNVVIRGDELMVVSGIQEYARRIRELRVEHGWQIMGGPTAKAMFDEGDLFSQPVREMGSDDYIMINTEQDRDAAYRWNLANEIRKTKAGVREKMLAYFRQNVGKPISGEELKYIAKDAHSWPRRIRELRTEEGWPIRTRMTGRPDLAAGFYIMEEDKQSEPHDRHIPDDVRVNVLRRDGFRCRKCSWSYNDARPGDPRHLLELHHATPHVAGGQNEAKNLVTLCNVDHDEVHRRKELENPDHLFVWLAKEE